MLSTTKPPFMKAIAHKRAAFITQIVEKGGPEPHEYVNFTAWVDVKLSHFPNLCLLCFCCFVLGGCSTSRLAGPTTAFAASIPPLQTSAITVTSTVLAADPQAEAQSIVDQATLGKLDSTMVVPYASQGDLIVELKALQGLTDYANALKALSNINTTSDSSAITTALKADMTSLGTDISNLPFVPPSVSSTAPSGIAGSITAIGNNVVNAVKAEKRDRAVKLALKAAKAPFEVICDHFVDLLRHDNGYWWGHIDGLYDTQEETIGDQYKIAFKKLQDDTKAKKPSDAIDQDKKSEVTLATSYAALVQKHALTVGMIGAVGEAFAQLKEAHNALVAYDGGNRAYLQSKLDALSLQIETVANYNSLLKAGAEGASPKKEGDN